MDSPETVGVETVLQAPTSADPANAGLPLLQQQHRVPFGTTIRRLLQSAGFQDVVDRIDGGKLGLSVYGKRAWLDDVLSDGSRVEVVAPIRVDAKAARVARAAADRSRRRGRVSSVR
jgi:putative ubiquitin-RnfH superfamily antitoxin RatB of RatAB toxin-antitoxin module